MAYIEREEIATSQATVVEHDEAMPRVAKDVYLSGNNKREQEKARKFLVDIGVRKVGEVERVEAILKQRYSKGSIKPRKQDMKRFIDLVEKEPNRQPYLATITSSN